MDYKNGDILPNNAYYNDGDALFDSLQEAGIVRAFNLKLDKNFKVITKEDSLTSEQKDYLSQLDGVVKAQGEGCGPPYCLGTGCCKCCPPTDCCDSIEIDISCKTHPGYCQFGNKLSSCMPKGICFEPCVCKEDPRWTDCNELADPFCVRCWCNPDPGCGSWNCIWRSEWNTYAGVDMGGHPTDCCFYWYLTTTPLGWRISLYDECNNYVPTNIDPCGCTPCCVYDYTYWYFEQNNAFPCVASCTTLCVSSLCRWNCVGYIPPDSGNPDGTPGVWVKELDLCTSNAPTGAYCTWACPAPFGGTEGGPCTYDGPTTETGCAIVTPSNCGIDPTNCGYNLIATQEGAVPTNPCDENEDCPDCVGPCDLLPASSCSLSLAALSFDDVTPGRIYHSNKPSYVSKIESISKEPISLFMISGKDQVAYTSTYENYKMMLFNYKRHKYFTVEKDGKITAQYSALRNSWFRTNRGNLMSLDFDETNTFPEKIIVKSCTVLS